MQVSVVPGVRLRWHYANIVTARGPPFASRLSCGASRGLTSEKTFEEVLSPATEARRFLPPRQSQLPPPAGSIMPTSQGEWLRIVLSREPSRWCWHPYLACVVT